MAVTPPQFILRRAEAFADRAGRSVRPLPGPSGRRSDSIAHPVPRPHSDEPGADPVLVPGAVPVFPLASFDLLVMQIGVIQTPTVPDPTPLPLCKGCAVLMPSWWEHECSGRGAPLPTSGPENGPRFRPPPGTIVAILVPLCSRRSTPRRGVGDRPVFLFSKGQLMRRMLASALVLGIFSTVGLIGCGEEAAVTRRDGSLHPRRHDHDDGEEVGRDDRRQSPARGDDPGHHALSDRSGHALRSRGGRFFSA